jgi:coenzyme F420-reducing hydrogenase alpha subunit
MKWKNFVLLLLFVGLVGGCATTEEIEKRNKINDVIKQGRESVRRLEQHTKELEARTKQLKELEKERDRQEWGTDGPLEVLILQEKKKINGLSRVKIGMKDGEVKQLTGETYDVNQIIIGSRVSEQWHYRICPDFIVVYPSKYRPDWVSFDPRFCNDVYLYFENGALVAIQQRK